MNPLKELTLGVEEEYQIVDPKSRELTSFVGKMLEQGSYIFRDQVQPELLQSQIEIGTIVCGDVKDLSKEICRLRSMVSDLAKKNNRAIIAAGTHPFSKWKDQLVTDKKRYHGFFDSMQIVAKRLLIFGMHIHVGIPDRNLRIDVMNQMRYFMPHILTLSTSSPFWYGEDTGFKSYRSIIFEDLPRTGTPEYFESAADYDHYVETLIKCGCIDEPTKIWWDIRPHPKFPTLEFRVCDCTTKVQEVTAIAALVQALVAKLIQLRKSNLTWRAYRHGFIFENKWRAMKEGVFGKLIDLGEEIERPVPQLMEEMLEFVDDVVDPLNSRKEIEYIRTMMKNGTSADRQLSCYSKTGKIERIVDMLIEETVEGCG